MQAGFITTPKRLLSYTHMKKVKHNFGENIRALRKKHGWTQIDLAQKLGCSQAIITAYESNKRKPPADKIAVLAGLFGVSVNDLYGEIATKVKAKSPKLWKKFEQIEKLPPIERSAIIKVVDAMLEKHGTNKKT